MVDEKVVRRAERLVVWMVGMWVELWVVWMAVQWVVCWALQKAEWTERERADQSGVAWAAS